MQQRTRESLELSRALFHVVCVNIAVLGGYFLPDLVKYLVAGLIFLLMMCVELTRLYSATYRHKVYAYFSWGYRSSEHDQFSPMVYMLVAIVILYFTLPFTMYAAALEVAACADPLARIMGKRFGRTHLPYNRKKSFVGSGTFLVVAASILFGFGFVWYVAIVAGVVAMLLEAYADGSVRLGPFVLEDNLLVPLGAGMMLYILA